MMTSVDLDAGQEAIFVQLVEVARSLPREQRQPFYATRVMGTHNYLLIHAGIAEGHPGIYPGDLDALAEQGLLRVSHTDAHTRRFDVTNDGFRYYELLKGRVSGSPRAVEAATVSYLDSGGFEARHSAAFAKWKEAERLLWGADKQSQQTVIGHVCREVMQAFATSFIAKHPSPDAPTDVQKSVARIRAALSGTQASSQTARAVANAALDYWGAVCDAGQRQEHGAQKEGEPLAWEDARRLVFHTLFVMIELDRIG